MGDKDMETLALEITCSLVTQVPTPEGSELERFVTVFVNDGRLKWRCHACRTKKDALGGTGRSLGGGRDPSSVANVLVHLANDFHARKVAALKLMSAPSTAHRRSKVGTSPGSSRPRGGARPPTGPPRVQCVHVHQANKMQARTQHGIWTFTVWTARKTTSRSTSSACQLAKAWMRTQQRSCSLAGCRVHELSRHASRQAPGTRAPRAKGSGLKQTTPAAETRFVMLACPFPVRLCLPPARIATTRLGCAHARVPSVHGMRAYHDKR